ncbi:hypothetical protein A3K64_03210 [Candidatus Micrarchaeota archaeon RBG_16_36_9]|nr:MAG: hypothetical protein A3K64_03210 [Candidatus Micrarchaeota archaeon RBG_16_36_9]
MFGYKEKAGLRKKISEIYIKLEDVRISSSAREAYVKSRENYDIDFVVYYSQLSRSPLRLLFAPKSSLEERLRNLENRLKEIKN